MSLGRRAALATVAGSAAGAAGQIVFVSLGLRQLLARSAALLTAVELVGAAHLVVLGARAVRDHASSPPRSEAVGAAGGVAIAGLDVRLALTRR